MLCRLTDVRHAPSEPPVKRTLADGDRRECVRSPTAARCAWLLWTAFPTKNSSLSIISYEKASQVFEEKELNKHSAVTSCQAGGSGEGEWSRRVALHKACMGVQVHTGTRIIGMPIKLFFSTKVRGRGEAKQILWEYGFKKPSKLTDDPLPKIVRYRNETATHGLPRVDCDLTVQLQTRLREMETENCILTFHSPFPLSTDSIPFGPRTQSLSIVRGSITLHTGTSCKAFTWLRSKIRWDIWQISCEIGDCRRRSRRKLWKKLDAASRFESFFFLSLERERSEGDTVHRCRHMGASVFDRRQKFCDSATRLDGVAKLSWRSNGLEGQIEPEIKRCGPTRVSADA